MATAEADYDQFTNPVDMVEHIATIHDWTFERSAPDELDALGDRGVVRLSPLAHLA